jgi:hypothetical protein
VKQRSLYSPKKEAVDPRLLWLYHTARICWLFSSRVDGDEGHYEIIATSEGFISLADNMWSIILEYCTGDNSPVHTLSELVAGRNNFIS